MAWLGRIGQRSAKAYLHGHCQPVLQLHSEVGQVAACLCELLVKELTRGLCFCLDRLCNLHIRRIPKPSAKGNVSVCFLADINEAIKVSDWDSENTGSTSRHCSDGQETGVSGGLHISHQDRRGSGFQMRRCLVPAEAFHMALPAEALKR